MKIFEIILKLAFLADAIYLLITKDFSTCYFYSFLIISFVLGIVLIFNKKQSYGYSLEKREIVMRRVEGVLLVIFSIVICYIQIKN